VGHPVYESHVNILVFLLCISCYCPQQNSNDSIFWLVSESTLTILNLLYFCMIYLSLYRSVALSIMLTFPSFLWILWRYAEFPVGGKVAAPCQNYCLRYLMRFFAAGHLNQKDQEDPYNRVTCLSLFFVLLPVLSSHCCKCKE
jgi:hypothetical protein